MCDYVLCDGKNCGAEIYEDELVYKDGTYVYCEKCAMKMLLVPLVLQEYDEGDVADWKRKDAMVCR